VRDALALNASWEFVYVLKHIKCVSA